MKKIKQIFFLLFIWLIIFIFIELGLFVSLKAYYDYRAKTSQHPKIFRDIRLYLSRFHPLFVNNDDLRSRNPDLEFDSIVGYKFAADTIHSRPYADYISYIEVDSEGFPHNGDYDKNKEFLAKNPRKIFRVVFLGGSTTVGRGASSNEHTIPAYFEDLLEKQWPEVDFQVINAGNFGYHFTEERLYYSFYIKPLKPDLVIFLDGDNDAMLAGIQKEWSAYFHDMKFSNERYQSIFEPSTALANYLKSLITFPQSLYSLFFIDKFIYKTRVIKGKLGKVKEKSEFLFHPQAVSNFAEELLTTAREISFEDSKAIFFLQPILGVKKSLEAAIEKEHLRVMEMAYPNYELNLNKYFNNFSRIYRNLNNKFKNNPKIAFVDISDSFENDPGDIYISACHCRDYGYRVIVEKMFSYAREGVRIDLKKKGLLKQKEIF